MADPTDVERLKQGSKVWNAWAEKLLSEKKQMEIDRTWAERIGGYPDNEASRQWYKRASVDFSEFKFKEDDEFHYIIFHDLIFPSVVSFEGSEFIDSFNFTSTQFLLGCNFQNATFNETVRFRKCTFGDLALFSDALFNREFLATECNFFRPSFSRSEFKHRAVFSKCRFDVASFHITEFRDSTSFTNCNFRKASFQRASFQSTISLAGSHFINVPIFFGADLSEPPRLDNISIDTPSIWKRGSNDLAAHWRRLKSFAISAHDHEREMEFFAQEVRARRFWKDKPWHLQFWIGVLYEMFSNFGRSFIRPIFWWLVSFMGFAIYYLQQHVISAKKASTSIIDVVQAAWLEKLSCVVGQGNPLSDALYLSLKNAAVLVGWERTFKINQVYFCLYGTSLNRSGGAIPEVPSTVAFWSIGQAAISAIMIFLFFLAIRNHFKIH